jgi:anion-transporting  ArsA/GET3 family ATPase
MASLLERKLIVVTGKGGAGKSTIACALGLIAVRRGLRTIVVEVGAQQHTADLFDTESSRVSALRDGQHSEHPDHPKDHRPLEHDRPAHNDPHRPRMHRSHHGEEIELQQNLWSTSLDPDRAMIEWLQTLTGRISARLLASSSTFQYFAAAAPGAKELVSMIKVRELCEGRYLDKSASGKSASGESASSKSASGGSTSGKSTSSDPQPNDRGKSRPYDLVVLDAPATGHALAMLHSPQTFAAIVRVGPLAEQAGRVQGLLEDSQRSGYVAVTHATEMAVTETLELEEGLRRGLDRDLDAIVVNGTVPRRFTREELEQISKLDAKQTLGLDATHISELDAKQTLELDATHISELDAKQIAALRIDTRVLHSAVQMAHAAHERARVQQSQIARLRRQRSADGRSSGVAAIQLAFASELDLKGVRDISIQLERKLRHLDASAQTTDLT